MIYNNIKIYCKKIIYSKKIKNTSKKMITAKINLPLINILCKYKKY